MEDSEDVPNHDEEFFGTSRRRKMADVPNFSDFSFSLPWMYRRVFREVSKTDTSWDDYLETDSDAYGIPG